MIIMYFICPSKKINYDSYYGKLCSFERFQQLVADQASVNVHTIMKKTQQIERLSSFLYLFLLFLFRVLQINYCTKSNIHLLYDFNFFQNWKLSSKLKLVSFLSTETKQTGIFSYISQAKVCSKQNMIFEGTFKSDMILFNIQIILFQFYHLNLYQIDINQIQK